MKSFQDSLVGKKTTFISVQAGSTSKICSDPILVQKITNAFALCKNGGCAEKVFTCEGENWYINFCAGYGGEISIGKKCSCSSTLAIRACRPDGNWGGAGGTTCGANTQRMSVTVHLKDG